MKKISIRIFDSKEVRAVWNDETNKWLYSVIDIIAILAEQDDYNKARNYWKWLKNKLKRENAQPVSAANRLKLKAPDGKSKQKAYALFDSSFIDGIEIGTSKGLQQIHSYLFGGLYDFAGQIRGGNISKSGFKFANVQFLKETLAKIDAMPEKTFDNIVDKYVEMNIAHPFREGNGRSTRIWLDLIFKQSLHKCVDWSKINKQDYFSAMIQSHTNVTAIKALLKQALTDKINDREMFMKGIDYSYYYEEEDTTT